MDIIASWLAAHIAVCAVIAFFVGIATAWAYAMYMIEVARRRAFKAASWDFAIMFLAQVITLTLWANTNDSVFVLIGFIFGNSVGTYLVTTFTKQDENGK